ncbi:TPA: hypothetical protein ACWZTV_001987 [Klebsiella pneumoniae]
MYHLDNTSGVPEMPEPKEQQSVSPRWFGESQEQGGISWPGADWFNMVQAELLSAAKKAGLTPEKDNFEQLSEAMKVLGDAKFREDALSSEAFALLGGRRKKLKEATTFLERLVCGLPLSLYEHADLVDKKGRSNPEEWDWTEAFKAFRDRIQSYNSFAISSGLVYFNPKAHIPAGRYLISDKIEFSDQLTSTRAYERTYVEIFGDGKNATTIKAGVNGITLFSFLKFRVHLHSMAFEGFGTGSTATTETLLSLGKIDASQTVSNSRFEKLIFKYGHKNIYINHAYDCLFTDVDIMGMCPGTSLSYSTGFEVAAVEIDNTNNIIIEKMHVEGSYGAFTKQFVTHNPLTAGSYHHSFGVRGLHLESRRYDTVNVDLNGLITSSFSDIHWVSNNGNGSDITYQNAERIVSLTDCYQIAIRDGYITRVGGLFDGVLPPILFESDVKNVVFHNMRLRAANTITTNINSYVTNNSKDTLSIANAFNECVFHNFDSSLLVTSLLKLSCMSNFNRSHFFNVDADGTLIQAYTTSSDGLTKTDGLRISSGGDVSPKSICVPAAVNLASGQSATYVLPNPRGNNASKRGLITIISKGSVVSGSAIFTTTGSAVLEHINGGLYKISAVSAQVSGYVNISLSGANILIENLTSGAVVLGISFLNFMDS